MPKEICGATVGDLMAVDDMHQRKAEMARRADAFIALPGTRLIHLNSQLSRVSSIRSISKINDLSARLQSRRPI